MGAQTRAALKASIKHWENNAAADTPYKVKVGPNYCDLCHMFNPTIFSQQQSSCRGCPVAAATGRPGCSGSPYYDVLSALRWWRSAVSSERAKDDFKRAANAEVEFLRNLLPEIDSD